MYELQKQVERKIRRIRGSVLQERKNVPTYPILKGVRKTEMRQKGTEFGDGKEKITVR